LTEQHLLPKEKYKSRTTEEPVGLIQKAVHHHSATNAMMLQCAATQLRKPTSLLQGQQDTLHNFPHLSEQYFKLLLQVRSRLLQQVSAADGAALV
jgi:hypothetical protein